MTEAKIYGVIFIAIVLFGSMAYNFYNERKVAHHLVEKDQNALYRLETYAKTAIEGMEDPWPGAQSGVELEALHIEHGILLLTLSLIDILFNIAIILLFGYVCFAYGRTKGIKSA